MDQHVSSIAAAASAPLTLTAAAIELDSGRRSSVCLVEQALARIADPQGEGATSFTRVYAPASRAAAIEADRMRSAGLPQLPLLGLPVAIKDCFDVAGDVTTAGSRVLEEEPPAALDASIVQRLRQSGAIVIGRTNMSEFAFSALGLNPHFGTPRNPYDRSTGRIPGGSSSGAAIAVSDAMVLAAVGTDTGGSVRIPAALCGLVGFKPTQCRVSRRGVVPLSPTLDSVGPIARSVACCSAIDAVISEAARSTEPPPLIHRMRLGVLQGYVLDDLDDPVANSYENAIEILSNAGFECVEFSVPKLAQLPLVSRKGSIAAAEAYAWHRPRLAYAGDRYDPRILERIIQGRDMSAADLTDLLEYRRELQTAWQLAAHEFDAVVMPAVPLVAPLISRVVDDPEAWVRTNRLLLRNPMIANLLDACAITVPCHLNGDAPVGLMAIAGSMQDDHLFRVGRTIEHQLEAHRRP